MTTANIVLVGHCARSGRLGIAAASDGIGIGARFDGAVRAHVGAAFVPGAPGPHNRLGLSLLAQGYAPAHVLRVLRDNDPLLEQGQIAIMDREGRAAAYTGGEAEHAIGEGCVAIAAQRRLLDALLRSFEGQQSAPLDARLLAALEHACAVGRPALRSVALMVFGAHEYSETDLRVDLHEDPLGALRRLYDEYQPFAVYYDERGRKPREAITQREFADMLSAQRGRAP